MPTCRACDGVLTDLEVKCKNKVTHDYEDFCTRCKLPAEFEYVEYEYILFIDTSYLRQLSNTGLLEQSEHY